MTQATQPWGVKGLTDSPRAPIVAKAKIGEKGPKGEPKRLDYIIFVEPQSGKRIPEFQEVFGERPTAFKALLPADDLRDIVDVAWKRYGKTGLRCRGDGETGLDRETGEELVCAGPYNFEDPAQHACEHARPRGEKPPECKPVLSMRLIVPQIPGLGVVQLDTGGVASSIQTLMWQLQRVYEATEGAMAGIAVQVFIRAFPDRFGNAAYSWQVQPLQPDQAQELQQNIEGLTRVSGQLPETLPALAAPDPELYGMTEPGTSSEVEKPEAASEAVPEDGCDVPEDWANKVLDAETAFSDAIAGLPPAKRQSAMRWQGEIRGQATEDDSWQRYVDSLRVKVDEIQEAGEGRLV